MLTHILQISSNLNLPHTADCCCLAYFSAISVSIYTKLTRSILMRERNIVTVPNVRKSLSKCRILSPKKPVICRFRPCKQQQFAAIADWSIATSGRRVQRPIAHKRIVIVSPKLAEGYSTTHATLRTSFKVRGQGHKLTSSVRLTCASYSFGKQNACTCVIRCGRGIPCWPNPAALPHCLLILLLSFIVRDILTFVRGVHLKL